MSENILMNELQSGCPLNLYIIIIFFFRLKMIQMISVVKSPAGLFKNVSYMRGFIGYCTCMCINALVNPDVVITDVLEFKKKTSKQITNCINIGYSVMIRVLQGHKVAL